MKRGWLLAAAAVVVAANGWVVFTARLNRADATGGAVELTERELGLPPMIGDSTALLLELNWNVVSRAGHEQRAPDWLGVEKLSELGFDCHVPATSPDARGHYSSLPARLVYLALEYDGEAAKKAGAVNSTKTRLYVVDAGREARLLRERYPDGQRYVITRGVVRIRLEERSLQDGAPLAEPRVSGWIGSVVPGQIFIPQPHSQLLQPLRLRDAESSEKPAGEPRFVATVRWGARYEPWVQSVRLLPGAESGSKGR